MSRIGRRFVSSDETIPTTATITNPTDVMLLDGTTAMSAALQLFIGTEALPGLTFDGDTDTGIRHSAANTIELVTGGADRWQITSAGHLFAVDDSTYDIGADGATRPRDLFLGRNLTVAGTATLPATAFTRETDIAVTITGTEDVAAPGLLRLINNRATQADNDAVGLQFYAENDADASVEIARIAAIYQDISAASDASQFDFTVFENNALAVVMSVGVPAPGQATSQLMLRPGTALLPAYSSLADPNTGVFLPDDDTIQFITGGAAELTLTTTSGTFAGALDVAGSTTLVALTLTGDLDAANFGMGAATPAAIQGSTTDIKDLLVTFGFLTDSGATPLNTDTGAITCGTLDCANFGMGVATPVGIQGDTTDIKDLLVTFGMRRHQPA